MTHTGMSLDVDSADLGYGAGPVITQLSLSVRPREILVITGPSGCGKSTLLRALAGLLPPLSGRIRADGHPVLGPSPDRAMVFQDDALLPWRTVQSNIELSLKLRGHKKADRRALATQWIDQVGLTGFGDYLPRDLSGGMKQRVQLARSLAASPRVILMDEPFGALDSQTRTTMQQLLVETWNHYPTTIVFVTHDVNEAISLGDRVVVLGRAGEPVRAVIDVPAPRTHHTDTPQTSALRARVVSALQARTSAA